MSKKNKFLYFAKSAPDGTTSTEEVAMFSVDRLSHFEMANATDMKIYFESNQEVNKDVDNAVVSLDITSVLGVFYIAARYRSFVLGLD